MPEGGVGSLGGGGRYDNLIGALGGRDLPATGISVGLERLLVVMEERGMAGAAGSVTQALVTILPETIPCPPCNWWRNCARKASTTEVTFDLRSAAYPTIQYAERKGIPYALIAGSDERAAGTVTIRDLRDREKREQQQVPRADLVTTLHHLLHA